jgi:hypothetical protein
MGLSPFCCQYLVKEDSPPGQRAAFAIGTQISFAPEELVQSSQLFVAAIVDLGECGFDGYVPIECRQLSGNSPPPPQGRRRRRACDHQPAGRGG